MNTLTDTVVNGDLYTSDLKSSNMIYICKYIDLSVAGENVIFTIPDGHVGYMYGLNDVNTTAAYSAQYGSNGHGMGCISIYNIFGNYSSTGKWATAPVIEISFYNPYYCDGDVIKTYAQRATKNDYCTWSSTQRTINMNEIRILDIKPYTTGQIAAFYPGNFTINVITAGSIDNTVSDNSANTLALVVGKILLVKNTQ